MNQAPIQLLDYYVEFLLVRANSRFDGDKPVDVDLKSLTVDADVQELTNGMGPDEGSGWSVSLKIQQEIVSKKNIPYEFELQLKGLVGVHPTFPLEKVNTAVQVNGPSMLFGVAREIIRNATGTGPYAPIVIPATNFFQRIPKAPERQSEASPTSKPLISKKAASKKVAKGGG